MTEPRPVTAILELLVARWPRAFSIYEARRRPLKIGVHLDILAALDGAVTPDDLERASRVYTANKVYRARCVAGAVRIGLDGEPAGVVTETEAKWSAATARAAKTATKAAPATTTSAAPKPIPQTSVPPVKRLSSLADLRAAAAACKAVTS
jgi:ProP effector